MRFTLRQLALGAAMTLGAAGSTAGAQQTSPAPAIDLSGVIVGSFGLRTDSAAAAVVGGQRPNQFGIDRVYLTVRAPAGENGAARLTLDVTQAPSAASTAPGWMLRFRFAYLQYTAFRARFGAGSNVVARIGVIPTVVIDHLESFWPRYLRQTAIEQDGFFSPADVGVSGLVTLPASLGEFYGGVTNGPGYTSPERDCFKDIAGRLSLTPLAKTLEKGSVLSSLTITSWMYAGRVASAFSAGGADQIGSGTNGAITSGLTRTRRGLFVGLKSRKLVLASEMAERHDAGESGANTHASPRVVRDSTGRVADAFMIVRPLAWIGSSSDGTSLIARIDRFTPSLRHVDSGSRPPTYQTLVLGASQDVTSRIAVALDWQVQSPRDFVGDAPLPRQSTVALRFQGAF